MSTPATPPVGSSIPELIPPKCPHCGGSLGAVSGFPYTLGTFAILCIYCPHPACGKSLHFQIFQAPPSTTDPSEPPTPKVWAPS